MGIPMKQDFSRSSITVAVTCFNREDTIFDCLSSIVDRGLPDVKILVLDDASTDGSVSIIQSFMQSHPAVSFMRHETNQGVAVARNTLIDAIDTEFFAFMDGDDLMLAGRLESQFALLLHVEEQFGHTDILCYGGRLRRELDGTYSAVSCMGAYSPYPFGDMVADYLLMHRQPQGYHMGLVGTCTLFARTQTVRKYGGFDPLCRRGQDTDLAIRVGLAGGACVGVPEPVIEQIMTEASYKSYERVVASYMYLLKKHKRYLASRRSYLFAIARTRKALSHNQGKKAAYLMYLMLCIIFRPAFLVRRDSA